MNPRMTTAVLVGVMALAASRNTASGGLVTWEFAGELTEVRDDDGSLGGIFGLGTSFAGQYTFESTTPDSSPTPGSGRYEGAVTSVSGIVGEVPFTEIPGASGLITVFDHPVDNYFVSGFRVTELLGVPVRFTLSLTDSTGSIFSDDSLLLTPPDISDFDSTFFELELEPDGDALIGEVTALVPEPSTLVLLVVGASLVIWRKR